MKGLNDKERSREWDYHKVRKYVNNHTLRREEFSVVFTNENKVILDGDEINQIIKKRKRSIESEIPKEVKAHITSIKDDKNKINEWLRKHYYKYSNKELAAVLGVQPSTIVKRARKPKTIKITVTTNNICCARSCVTKLSAQRISDHFNAIWSESNETNRRTKVIAMLREFRLKSNELPCIRFCKQVFLISHQMRTRCINDDKSKSSLNAQNQMGGFASVVGQPNIGMQPNMAMGLVAVGDQAQQQLQLQPMQLMQFQQQQQLQQMQVNQQQQQQLQQMQVNQQQMQVNQQLAAQQMNGQLAMPQYRNGMNNINGVVLQTYQYQNKDYQNRYGLSYMPQQFQQAPIMQNELMFPTMRGQQVPPPNNTNQQPTQ